ncbi:MAG: hypothetical protein H7Z12_14840 [Rhodospirillaceae bacterium]|nr:hypothetical protein [Rhodospirillales bacterium]
MQLAMRALCGDKPLRMEANVPAVNLIYATKDGVFNCYDKITGYTKKKYDITPTVIPAIDDALQANTILVLPSHSTGAAHQVKFNNQYYSVSQYAGLVLAKITNRAKVTKVVYLICSADATVAAIAGVHQVAPNALLTYSVGPPALLTVAGQAAGLSPNEVVALAATNNGFVYH